MPNQFVARGGIFSSGSIIVTGSVTSSLGFFGTGSYANTAFSSVSASYASTVFASTSSSFATRTISSSHAIAANTADSSSFATRTISSSHALNANSSNTALTSTSSSFADRSISSSHALNANNSTTASYALASAGTGLSGGTVNYIPLWTSATAQSSSNIYQSASNVSIGTTASLYSSALTIQQNTNSRMLTLASTDVDSNAGIGFTNDAVQWSLSLRGIAGGITDGLVFRNVTAGTDLLFIDTSGNVSASNFIGTGSHALTAVNSVSSSFATRTISSSHALASNTSISSSFATRGISSSFALASHLTDSSSFATSAISSSFGLSSISSSYAGMALSASYALNGGGSSTPTFPFTGSAIISGGLLITGSGGLIVRNPSAPTIIIEGATSPTLTIQGTGGTGSITIGSDVRVGSVSNTTLTLMQNNTAAWFIDANKMFVPNVNNSYDIGLTGTRVRTLWVTNISASNAIPTASFATRAISSSHALNANLADSSSFATRTISSSHALASTSSSFATSTISSSFAGTVGVLSQLTITGLTSVSSILEKATINAGTPSGLINVDISTQPVLYYTGNAAGNISINLRGDGSNTLNSILNVGQSVSTAVIVTNGATPYYITGSTIDNVNVVPKWQNGTAPSAGNANSIDVYTYTIIKTAATPTYTVFASVTKFA